MSGKALVDFYVAGRRRRERWDHQDHQEEFMSDLIDKFLTRDIEILINILQWVRTHRKQALLMTLLSYAIAVPLTIFLFQFADKDHELRQLESISFGEQTHALDEIEGSIKNLLLFVEKQKIQVRESEHLLQGLKEEEKKLKPVVEAQREAVNAILEAQAAKHRAAQVKGYMLSFVLGVLSSLTATFLAYIGFQAIRQRLNVRTEIDPNKALNPTAEDPPSAEG